MALQVEYNDHKSSENIEIELLFEAIFRKHGYDFRNYSMAHLKRRIHHRLSLSGLQNISQLQHKILYDEEFFREFVFDLSINVTEMFRDPLFYKAMRKEVVPLLKTYPFLKIWHAGCASGEEVYSMAILLQEEGLSDRTQIYATDFNHLALKKAKDAIYSVERIKDYTKNYQLSGGKASFADYYNAHYNSVMLKDQLKKNIVFADHNLVTDSVFGEMNMIICRNVMIYFNKELQNKVIKLFVDSLAPRGLLCLGSKESLRFNTHAKEFSELVSTEKIYLKNF